MSAPIMLGYAASCRMGSAKQAICFRDQQGPVLGDDLTVREMIEEGRPRAIRKESPNAHRNG